MFGIRSSCALYGLKPNGILSKCLTFFTRPKSVDQQKYLCAGVELFTVLLEEATTDFLPISEDVRDIFVARIRIHADSVLIYLSKCLQMEIQEPQRIFTCFKSWIKYGEITPTQLAASPMIKACFAHISAETIIEILRCYNRLSTDAPVIQTMIPLVMSLSANINSSDQAHEIARIMTSMGESYTYLWLRKYWTRKFGCSTAAVQHNDTEIAKVALPFWEDLKYYLVDRETF